MALTPKQVIDRAYSLLDFGEDVPSLKKELAAYRESFSLFEALISGS